MAENSDSTNPSPGKPAPVISNETVEAAVAAFFETAIHKWPDIPLNDAQRNLVRSDMLRAIRAAILADRAETIEACAKVAESGYYSSTLEVSGTKKAIASAIRSLGAYKPGKADE